MVVGVINSSVPRYATTSSFIASALGSRIVIAPVAGINPLERQYQVVVI